MLYSDQDLPTHYSHNFIARMTCQKEGEARKNRAIFAFDRWCERFYSLTKGGRGPTKANVPSITLYNGGSSSQSCTCGSTSQRWVVTRGSSVIWKEGRAFVNEQTGPLFIGIGTWTGTCSHEGNAILPQYQG